MKHRPIWLFFTLAIAALFISALYPVWGAPPQTASRKTSGTKHHTKAQFHKRREEPVFPPAGPGGAVYTPATLVGPDTVGVSSGSETAAPKVTATLPPTLATYTVTLDKPADDSEGLALAEDTDDYPKSLPSSSTRGILYKVQMYSYDFVDEQGRPTLVKRKYYHIAGRNGVLEGSDSGTFTVQCNNRFPFPDGQNEAHVLLEVWRMNTDRPYTSKYKGIRVTIKK